MSTPAYPLVFPVQSSPFSLPCQFYKNDGTLITGWTGASVTITTMGSVWSGSAPTVVESNSNGDGWIELTGPMMAGKLINVIATVSNSGALPFVANIVTDGLVEIELAIAAWFAQAPVEFTGSPTTFYQALLFAAMAAYNQITRTTNQQTLYKSDGTVCATALVQDGTGAQRNKYA